MRDSTLAAIPKSVIPGFVYPFDQLFLGKQKKVLGHGVKNSLGK